MKRSVSDKNQNTRQEWIDIARGLGMIIVVLGHCNPPEWLRITIGSFHMPFFFFLTGLVINESRNLLDRRYIIKDFIRLIIPYIITVIIIGASLIIMWQEGKNGYYSSLLELSVSALYGSGTGRPGIKLIGEIWFLLAMFWSRRIMAVVLSVQKRTTQMCIIGFFVAISILLSKDNVWLPMSIDVAFLAVGFIYAGWMTKKHIEMIEDTGILLVMMLVYIAARCSSTFGMADRNYSSLWYISIPGAIAMSCLLCRLSKGIERVAGLRSTLAFIGRHTLLFMCIHSLDWRMPFPKPGQIIVSAYSNRSWYWLLSFVHRFCFDLLLVLGVCVVIFFYKKYKNGKRDMHE